MAGEAAHNLVIKQARWIQHYRDKKSMTRWCWQFSLTIIGLWVISMHNKLFEASISRLCCQAAQDLWAWQHTISLLAWDLSLAKQSKTKNSLSYHFKTDQKGGFKFANSLVVLTIKSFIKTVSVISGEN